MRNLIGVLVVLLVGFILGSTLYVIGWMPLVLAVDWLKERTGLY
ncbi:MAG: hypothetical protein ACREMS_09615 [Gemmatimonadaceae bacterium]